jgi:phage baseplate assembly protein W
VAARTFTKLGTDLALTRYVGLPSAVELDVADTGSEGLDLAVVPGGPRPGGPRPGGARSRRRAGDVADMGTVSGRADLAQALIVRLLTPRGGLAGLGHADYGSRLGELIGRGNTATTRNLARLYTIQALGEERRVKRVEDLRVDVPPGRPDTVQISFSVVPVADDDPLALTLEVVL